MLWELIVESWSCVWIAFMCTPLRGLGWGSGLERKGNQVVNCDSWPTFGWKWTWTILCSCSWPSFGSNCARSITSIILYIWRRYTKWSSEFVKGVYSCLVDLPTKGKFGSLLPQRGRRGTPEMEWQPGLGQCHCGECQLRGKEHYLALSPSGDSQSFMLSLYSRLTC